MSDTKDFGLEVGKSNYFFIKRKVHLVLNKSIGKKEFTHTKLLKFIYFVPFEPTFKFIFCRVSNIFDSLEKN